MYPDFLLNNGSIQQFFLSPIFYNQSYVISGFLSHISIVRFDAPAEKVYLKLQVTIFKIKEVRTNPQIQTLKKTIFQKSLNPQPSTLNPRP